MVNSWNCGIYFLEIVGSIRAMFQMEMLPLAEHIASKQYVCIIFYISCYSAVCLSVGSYIARGVASGGSGGVTTPQSLGISSVNFD